MADEQKPKERKKRIEPEAKDSSLPATPKAVADAAGKKAAPAEVAEPAPTPLHTKSTKIPKLQKKNRSRLPRRQKKANQKATATREV